MAAASSSSAGHSHSHHDCIFEYDQVSPPLCCSRSSWFFSCRLLCARLLTRHLDRSSPLTPPIPAAQAKTRSLIEKATRIQFGSHPSEVSSPPLHRHSRDCSFSSHAHRFAQATSRPLSLPQSDPYSPFQDEVKMFSKCKVSALAAMKMLVSSHVSNPFVPALDSFTVAHNGSVRFARRIPIPSPTAGR